MKNIKDLLKPTAKIITGIALAAMPYISSGQSVLPEFSFNACMVPYSQPNIHTVNGLDALDYHGSGSLGDKISQSDVEAAKTGVYKYRLDVDGDIDVDMDDANLIQQYVNKETDHLPGHWNKLNGIEKRHWLGQYLKQSKTRATARGKSPSWSCGIYSAQELVNTFGQEKPELMLPNDWDWSENGRWNIPMCKASVMTTDNIRHSINATLAGPNTKERFVENPLKRSHWELTEPQLQTVVKEGDYSLNPTGPILINWYGHNARGPPWNVDLHPVEFDLSKDKENAIKHSSYLVLTNPNKPVEDTEAPVMSNIENKTYEYRVGLDLSPSVTGTPTVTDNLDPNPTLSYKDTTTKESSGKNKFNYVTIRTWTSTDKKKNSRSLEVKLTVHDTTSPVISGGTDQSFEYSTNLVLPKDATVTDNGEIKSLVYTDVSTQVMDGTINQVNYTVDRTLKSTDVVGNYSNFTWKYSVSDNTPATFDIANIKIGKDDSLETSVTGVPSNIKDNSGLPVKMSYKDYITNYDGGKVVSRQWTGTDVAKNSFAKMQKITMGNPIIPDSKTPHLLKVYREGEDLQIKYFADNKEKIEVQVIDIANGKITKSLASEVEKGDNMIIMPFPKSNSMNNIVRVIDEDETNVQEKRFIDR